MCVRLLDLGNPLGRCTAETCAGTRGTHNNNSRGNVTRPATSWPRGNPPDGIEFNSVYIPKWSLFTDVWICAFLLYTVSSIDSLASDFYILASHFVPMMICRHVPMVCIPYIRFTAWNGALRTYIIGAACPARLLTSE